MSARFIHTADWQIGKPFAGIEEAHQRALVQQERLQAISRIGEAAREHGAEFILIAGDLFDTATVTKATVSAACSALGRLGCPVLAIPGNHDHGGPESIWEQAFFQREQASLAPNFRILLQAEPVELPTAVIYPCPLRRRAEARDPAAWLHGRALEAEPAGGKAKARVVLAHGSTQSFAGLADEEETEASGANLLDLARLPEGAFDYVALGDWHGLKQVGPKAWYAGTPELDRFPKGEANAPGQVLAVVAARGRAPEVTPVSTARFRWHREAFDFSDDAALEGLRQHLETRLGQRAQEDLLHLELTGSLGIEATTQLELFLEALQARLLRLKLANRTVLAPTVAESEALRERTGDPLISQVATALTELAAGEGEEAAIARVALRELHAACAAR